MYSCAQVTKWIASDEYLQAGPFRRLGVRIHLLMCRLCSTYVRQLRALSAALRGGETGVPESEVEAAKERILQKLARKT